MLRAEAAGVLICNGLATLRVKLNLFIGMTQVELCVRAPVRRICVPFGECDNCLRLPPDSQ